MKTQWNKHKVLLAIGLLFIFSGILLLVFFASSLSVRLYILRPVLILIVGAFILYQTLIGTRKSLFIFTGLLLCCTGLLLLLIDAQIIPYKLSQVWPALVTLSGVMLIPLGYSRHRRLQASYIVPGIVLVGFGIVFFCFSFDIITIPFVEFARRWWPLVFILFGIALIGLFLYTQKKPKSFLFDETDDDEDLS